MDTPENSNGGEHGGEQLHDYEAATHEIQHLLDDPRTVTDSIGGQRRFFDFVDRGIAISHTDFSDEEPLTKEEYRAAGQEVVSSLRHEREFWAPFFDEAIKIPEEQRANTPMIITNEDGSSSIFDAQEVVGKVYSLDANIHSLEDGEADEEDQPPSSLYGINVHFHEPVSQYGNTSIHRMDTYDIFQYPDGRYGFQSYSRPVVYQAGQRLRRMPHDIRALAEDDYYQKYGTVELSFADVPGILAHLKLHPGDK